MVRGFTEVIQEQLKNEVTPHTSYDGTYQLVSGEPMEWKAGYTVTPELYGEATQR